MDNFKKWVALLKENGLLCDMYSEKVDNAKSKLELVRCCLDANGVDFLQEMQSAGFPLPYEVVCSVFRSYINGRYVAEFKNDKGNGYTSCVYCCFSDFADIHIETTITTILGCKSNIWVSENDFVRLVIDKNCELAIHVPDSSRCIIDYWDGAKVVVYGDMSKVTMNKH